MKQKKTTRTNFSILAGLVVLLLLVVLYLCYQHLRSQPSVTESTNSLSGNGNWQLYKDEIEGYQFEFAPNYILTYLPTNEGVHRYGVFETQEDSDECVGGLPEFNESCYKAYYFVLISGSNEIPSDLINVEKYIDTQGREWILATDEVGGVFRIEGFLKQNDIWQRISVEVPLFQKEYPAFLNEAMEIAKTTFSSWK